MTIRPAKAADTVRVIALMREALGQSRFAGRVDVNDRLAKALLVRGVHFHGGSTDGAMFYLVSERDGKIEGFFLGTLGAFYHVGTKLQAQDIYLFQTARAYPRDAVRMVDAFLDWINGNEDIISISMSDSDFITGNEQQIERFFTKRGFVRSHAVYSKDVN